MERLVDSLIEDKQINFDDSHPFSLHAENEIFEYFFSTDQCCMDYCEDGILDKVSAEEAAIEMAESTHAFQFEQRKLETQWNDDFFNCYDTLHQMNRSR